MKFFAPCALYLIFPIFLHAMDGGDRLHKPIAEEFTQTALAREARDGAKLASLKELIHKKTDLASPEVRYALLSGALIEATRNGRYFAAKVLLEKGADSRACICDTDITAWAIARENEYKGIMSLFRKVDAKLQARAASRPHFSVHLGRKGKVLSKR